MNGGPINNKVSGTATRKCRCRKKVTTLPPEIKKLIDNNYQTSDGHKANNIYQVKVFMV